MSLRIIPAALSVLLLAACAQAATATPAPAGAGSAYRVYVDLGDSVKLLGTGRTPRVLPPGVLSRDGSRLFTIAADHSKGSVLQAVDTSTGKVVASEVLGGFYELMVGGPSQGLSPGGSALALERTSVPGSYLVVSTDLKQAPKRVALSGPFEFDAVGDDGASLFLIEHLNLSLDYRVRRYDLAGGRLDPQVLVEKGAAADSLMNGERYASVAVAGSSTVYSLYFSRTGPFIHALSLTGGPILCFDLPGIRASDPARQSQWALAFDPTRNLLYAVNAAVGNVSRVDLGSGQITSGSFSPPAAPAAGWWPIVEGQAKVGEGLGSATISPDGKTLFANAVHGYVAIDAATLKLRGSYLAGNSVGSLAATPDGRWLLAVRDFDRLVRLGVADGRVDATLFISNGPMAVLRVVSAT